MAESFVQLPPDGTGKKQRTYEKSTAGHDAYAIYGEEFRITGRYTATSFRIVGTAVVPALLATIQNTAGAANIIALRSVTVDQSKHSTSVQLTAQFYFAYHHLTGVTPTGGTLATMHKIDSASPASQANTEIRFGASADGTNTLITHAAPTTNPAARQCSPKAFTASPEGQWTNDDFALWEEGRPPLLLRAGETGLVQVEGAAWYAGASAVVTVTWDEVTIP